MLLYGITIFLSAFLLFQVQPLIAKTILAWFGGTASVWTTCMLFFQMVLLAGYFYSHVVIERLTPKRQAMVHSALLAIALALLPITPADRWKPTGTENPTVQILILLAASVGLPYLLCSTTGPLLQAWYARQHAGSTPYRLFALSNLGSMLALLTYPTLVEPSLEIPRQGWMWSAGFAVFAALAALLAWRGANVPALAAGPAATDSGEEGAPSGVKQALWVALAACPSLMLLAVTNHLTQDVASVPFLWILPLALYLLSFILTFDSRGWYHRTIYILVLAPALCGIAYLQWTDASDLGMRKTVAIFCAAFFLVCMFCHGELALRKPAPRYLTSFYLMLAVGGALGGLFAGVVAPYLFISYFELPVAIGLCAVLAYVVAVEEPGKSWMDAAKSAPGILLLTGVIGFGGFLGRTMVDAVKGYLLVERNFYGTLRVREAQKGEWDGYRSLLHGSINHGEQWTHPDRKRDPITYYCPESGIGRAIRLRKEGVPHKVGVMGLGAGTMAGFARQGDEYRFYEINPLVPQIANREFTYVPDCRGKLDIVMGDARLSLEREAPQNFDLLMMDAFSGDSIPIHLVTREAFQLYFKHMKPGGVIVVHISNKYLDLEPVVARAAKELGKAAFLVDSEEDTEGICFGTTYVLVSDREETFLQPIFNGARRAETRDNVGIWTDSYSNLFRILK